MIRSLFDFKSSKIIFYYQKLLIQRFHKRLRFYTPFVLIFFIPFSLYIILIFYQFNFSKFEEGITFSSGFSEVIIFAFIADLICAILRFSAHTTIEPHHLKLFPLTKFERMKNLLFIYFRDIKIIFYVFPILLFGGYSILHFQFITALLIIILFSLIIFNTSSWITGIFSFIGDLSKDKRKQILSLSHLIFIPFIFIHIFTERSLYEFLPVVSNGGKALVAILQNDISKFLLNSIILFVFGIIGISFLYISRDFGEKLLKG